MADQLCTIAQVKARLKGPNPTDVTDDTMLTELVEEVSDWIQHYTGRRFVPITSTTYILSTTQGNLLRIPIGVRSVSALLINTLSHQPDTGGSYPTTITAANILLRPSAIDLPPGWPPTEIRLSRAQSTLFGTIENGASVTGTFGFAATPPDIQAVAIDGTVSAYQMRKNGTSGVFGADDATGVPWWQFTNTAWKTLGMYRYPGMS
jgi:hypothetical protein